MIQIRPVSGILCREPWAGCDADSTAVIPSHLTAPPQPSAYHRAMGDPVVASAWRRALASLLDSAPLLVLSGFWLAWKLRNPEFRRKPRFSRPVQRTFQTVNALSTAYLIREVATEGQTFGHRVAGIRVVDHRSGHPPGWFRAALRWALAWGAPQLLQVLQRLPPMRHQAQVMAELEPQLADLRAAHAHHPRKRHDETRELMARNGITPVTTLCSAAIPLGALLAIITVVYGPILRQPLHQGLHDRICGTIVVRA